MAIDPAAGRIYWAAPPDTFTPGDTGAIRVANLDGSGTPVDLFAGESSSVRSVTIEPAAGKIYWAVRAAPGAIRVGNLDGSGTPVDLFAGENGPSGLAIDAAAGKIYWANNGGAIRVGNLDGSGATTLFTEGLARAG